MVQFVPYEPWHIKAIAFDRLKPEIDQFVSNPEYAAFLAARGVAMTAIADGGRVETARVLGAAGLTHLWPGRSSAWALLGEVRPTEWTAIVRRMREMLDAAQRNGVRRIEATADTEFEPGCRLLDVLEFDEPRQLLRAYGPEGRDHFLYARVRACADGRKS